jgi:hypothetical protein
LKRPPTARVDTLATRTDVAVMPVWSLKALDGIAEFPEPEPDPEPEPEPEVVVDDELVEPQATAVVATATINPTAPRRVLHVVESKVPPCNVDPCTAHLTRVAAPPRRTPALM